MYLLITRQPQIASDDSSEADMELILSVRRLAGTSQESGLTSRYSQRCLILHFDSYPDVNWMVEHLT